MAKVFQEFRCKGEVIRIETITDSDGEQCVLWRDIRTAFPGMTRIQHGSVFVPIVKDNRFYRKKPHRILYHAGVLLDVIYMSDSPKPRTSGDDQDAMDVQPHGKNSIRESHASPSSYCTAHSGSFVGELSDAGGKSATSAPEQSASVTSPAGSSVSSIGRATFVGATSMTLSQSQAQTQHGARPWFSGLMQTLPTLSTRSKGSATDRSPPLMSPSSTSLANVNASCGSIPKSKSPARMLSAVPSSVSSSSGDS